MKDRKTFYLLAPGFSDAHLTKDVGLIPYLMQKYMGYEAVYAIYKPSKGEMTWPSLPFFSEDIKFDYIEPSFEYDPDHMMETVFGSNLSDCAKDVEKYIQRNAAKIDVLYLFGFYPFYFHAVMKYKQLNPAGKVYLKLDANIAWINKTPIDSTFFQFLRSCDLITTETMVDYINQKWPVPVYYLPNGYYPLGSDDRLNTIFEFENKEDIIFTAGRLGTPQKLTDQLLQAFKLAVPHIPASWKLVLAGSIEEQFLPYIDQFMKDNEGLAERIIFTGMIKDKTVLNDWFAKSKIFALPSAYEGFPNVFAEARAHGCYYIASDIEYSRDAAMHESSKDTMNESYAASSRHVGFGSLHAVGDTAELAERFIEACNNPELLQKVCYRTQQDAIEYLDWVKLCAKIDIMLNMKA
ncbi:glycosyltransferase family 4 protein [Paenibacillus xylaniclasticus]|uniref:glycosyltransferase family 4 protein n=1 Tax=Paenibacillus xylaniclasticus TaxID=588083 RepID=UPI000FD9AD69|nr:MULTISPECIES: glycosyltransferase family 4 protein [Paenibacillus]GFN33095.1 hypothetical protein PCURB6_33550 [Paenibacillus curdlanolyticus]